MCALKKNVTTVAVLVVVNSFLIFTSTTYASHIGSGSYSAGLLGNYAGHLGGGEAVSELHHSQIDAEGHDFSEGAATSLDNHYESLGSVGDHLQEQHFPSDYHGDESSAPTEHHFDYASHSSEHVGDHYENSYHGDFHSEPVRGIDHGKGAFSYSTTYESKEP